MSARPPVTAFYVQPRRDLSPYVHPNPHWLQRTALPAPLTFENIETLTRHLKLSMRRHQPDWRTSLADMQRDAERMARLIKWFGSPLRALVIIGPTQPSQVHRLGHYLDILFNNFILQPNFSETQALAQLRQITLLVSALNQNIFHVNVAVSQILRQRASLPDPSVDTNSMHKYGDELNEKAQDMVDVTMQLLLHEWQLFDSIIRAYLLPAIEAARERHDLPRVRALEEMVIEFDDTVGDTPTDFLRLGVRNYGDVMNNAGEIIMRHDAYQHFGMDETNRRQYEQNLNGERRIVSANKAYSSRRRRTNTLNIPKRASSSHSLKRLWALGRAYPGKIRKGKRRRVSSSSLSSYNGDVSTATEPLPENVNNETRTYSQRHKRQKIND